MRSSSLKIRDVAVHEPVTARPTDSIGSCARRMHDEHVGCLVVVEESDGDAFPVGVLTDRDIAIEVVAFGIDASALTAGDVMQGNLAVARDDEGLLAVLATMRSNGVRRLPVVDAQGALVGILSADDLWEVLAEEVDSLVRVIKAEQSRERRTRAAKPAA